MESADGTQPDETGMAYADLLDAGHRQGLTRITTTLVQRPSTLNRETAIVAAEVELAGGTYTGSGAASPEDVVSPLHASVIALAEDRAKQQALRDALRSTRSTS